MNSHGLTKENLLSVFPVALRQDPSAMALADAFAEALAARPEEIRKVAIYPRIDEMDEAMLDILAYDFKVDWYDYGIGLQAKRAQVKSSFAIHRYLGTKGAVLRALRCIYPSAQVEEWFEYGGRPYCFRATIGLGEDALPTGQYRVLKRQIDFYKNLRSWLDAIIFRLPTILLHNEEGFFFRRLHVSRYRLHTYCHCGGPIRLNGDHLLDGEWMLGAGKAHGGEIRLDGSYLLDGGWILDGGRTNWIYEKEPGYFHLIRVQFGAWFHNYCPEVVRLDGTGRLNSEWLLGGGAFPFAFPRLSAGIFQMQGFAGNLAFPRLRLAFEEPFVSYGGGAIYLDGEKLLDGGWQLDQGFGAVRMRSARYNTTIARQPYGLNGTLTRDKMWRLDGADRLDGTRTLDAFITKEEI